MYLWWRVREEHSSKEVELGKKDSLNMYGKRLIREWGIVRLLGSARRTINEEQPQARLAFALRGTTSETGTRIERYII